MQSFTIIFIMLVNDNENTYDIASSKEGDYKIISVL